jgi:hypothetical protein
MRWRSVVWLGLMLACGRGEQPAAKAPSAAADDVASRVVAHLNGAPIEVDDLRVSFPLAMRGDLRPALDATVARRLVADEARRRGLDAKDDVQAQLAALRSEAAAREETLLRDALVASLDADVAVSEEELRAQYEKAPMRFMEPQLHLRRAAFPTAEAAQAENARLGADGRLDPAASEELGPAPVEELMQQGIMGMMRLQEPGERIVVPREGHYELIELIERLPPAPLPFEKVRPQLEVQLRSQRAGEAFAKLVEELRAKAKLEVDEAALAAEAARAPQPGGAPHPGRPWR